MCMRSREVRGCRFQSDPGAPHGRQAPGMLRGSLGETGSIGCGLGLPAFRLVLALCLPLASGAQERASSTQDQAVPEAEFDLADVLITRTPLPGSLVEPRGSSGGEKSQSSKEKSWWQQLSLAIGAQFPLTQAREFEWGLTTSLKLDL